MKKIHLAITDSHPIFLEGLSSILGKTSGIEIVASTSTVGEMFARFKEGMAQLLLMDVNHAKVNNLDFVPKFKKNYPDLKIIALSIYNQYKFAEDVIDQGCNGYILKNTTKDDLLRGVHRVMEGEIYMGEGLYIPVQSGKIDYAQSLNNRNKFLNVHNLTRREVDIISLIAQGHSNKEIAQAFYISEHTVKAHRRNLKAKLHLSNTADIVRFAFQTGIVRL